MDGHARLVALRRVGGYSGAGAIGTACHYLLLVTLVSGLRTPLLVSTAVAAAAGALVNYRLNHRFVFRSTRPHREALPRFLFVAGAGVLVNVAVVAALAKAGGLHYLGAQVAATAVVLVAGFLLNQRWTFSE